MFHPETGPFGNDKIDKCHQLQYFIHSFITKAEKGFDLGTDVYFDGGGIAMKKRYCPVHMYNKKKPTSFVLIYLSCQIQSII